MGRFAGHRSDCGFHLIQDRNRRAVVNITLQKSRQLPARFRAGEQIQEQRRKLVIKANEVPPDIHPRADGRLVSGNTRSADVAAAQGRIIPDSMYGRVFEWDATLHHYSYQGTTVANLNGVRFILYALGLDGEVVEPVSAIGTLDIIDESTPQQLKLHVLVKGPGGTTTYLDYLATVTSSTSANATASGFISNGLGGAANKTLSFDETLSVNGAGARITATFALNNPVITLMMNEAVSFNNPNITLDADFRLIQNGETIRTVGHITINTVTNVTNITVTVYLNGHPVASIDGDPSDPGTEWVDAGGEPLTIADLDALDHLFDAWSSFQQAVSGLLAPISTFGGA